MKKLLASTAILLVLSACASNRNNLPSTDASAPNPMPINAASGNGVGTTLPIIEGIGLIAPKSQERAQPGTRRPTKGEIRGNTWKPDFDPDSEYWLPVQTTNTTGTRPVQQVLVTSDLPVGRGSCAHKGFEVVPMGSAIAIAPFPGAPVGAQDTCVVEFGGQRAKLIVEATSKRGISELNLIGRKKRDKPSFPQGVCSSANYHVSNLVEGGPLGACTVVDATGASTATYLKLPANAGDTPMVKTGDGQNARLANFTSERLPTGEILVRVQGSQKQIVLDYQDGRRTVLTRGS